MKKNLRIVSAAAAALLAVAPVAATAIATPATTVSADAQQTDSTQYVFVPGTTTVYNGKGSASTPATTVAASDLPTKATTITLSSKSEDVYVSGSATPVKGYKTTIKGNDYYVVKSGAGAVSVLSGFAKNPTLTSLAGLAGKFVQGAPAGVTVTKPNSSDQTVSNFKTNNVNIDNVNAPQFQLKTLGADGLSSRNVSGTAKVGNVFDKNYNVKQDTDKVPADGFVEIDVNYDVPAGTNYDLGDGNGIQTAGANGVTVKYMAAVNGSNASNNGNQNNGNQNNGNQNNGNQNTTNTTKPSASINAGASSIYDADANMSVVVNAVAAQAGRPSAINGSISATYNNNTVTALLHGDTNTTIYKKNPIDHAGQTPLKANELKAGHYYAEFNDVTLNLGNAAAGQTVKFTLPVGSAFVGTGSAYSNKDKFGYRTFEVKVDNTGVAHLGNIVSEFYAYDATNMEGIHFYSIKTGDVVTSGSVDLHAVNGKVNVESVFAALSHEYGAAQFISGKAQPLYTVNDFRDQLKKQNIDVDANGYFTAPSSFSLTLTARSNNNGASVQMPVTVNVDNATASNNTNESTKNVTIMHIATIYDKNGKATNEPALRAYNSVSVVTDPVTIAGAKFYKLAGKDQYIKVGNVDGTSRSLKKNSYVYRSNGKAYMKSKKHHRVLKSGSSVTTYGKSFMINGSQMYRIGRNQYVKKANF